VNVADGESSAITRTMTFVVGFLIWHGRYRRVIKYIVKAILHS